MDILMSETCWAHKNWNKTASDIKLVFHSSTSVCVYLHAHCVHSVHFIQKPGMSFCDWKAHWTKGTSHTHIQKGSGGTNLQQPWYFYFNIANLYCYLERDLWKTFLKYMEWETVKWHVSHSLSHQERI